MPGDVETPGQATEGQAGAADATPASSSEAAPPETQQEATWTPDSLPETERESARKWAEAEAEKKYRAKVGAENGWASVVPQEDREALRANPRLLAELREQANLTKALSDQLGQGKKEPQEPDPLEEGWKRFSEKYTVEERNKPFLRDLMAEAARAAEARAARHSENVADGKVRLAEVTRQHEAVKSDPLWNDPVKGPLLQNAYWGYAERNKGKYMPNEVWATIKQIASTPSASTSQQTSKPALGDTGGVSATQRMKGLSARDAWLQSDFVKANRDRL